MFKVVIIIAIFNCVAATSLHSQSDDSDVEVTGVEYHSPPPASLDESEDKDSTTALEGEEEEEEEEEVRTCVVN